MYFMQLLALLPLVLYLAAAILFFVLFYKMYKASINRNEILKDILSELRSRKE